ncbi:unnamed protein product [Ciceribacter selenitireducens ATCC BAA-1503]|uniref:Uncharacterized protein n=1 Tax=Ciceribacter selenitireducens ATCC BAA-1503 TaxID=1336235 RepID=A0A376AE27_9HYPH|nr:unnamed protein product [Ciceribacter selenitireducens ATCC BAA-1503]
MASEWQRCHSLFEATCFVNRLFAACRLPQSRCRFPQSQCIRHNAANRRSE